MKSKTFAFLTAGMLATVMTPVALMASTLIVDTGTPVSLSYDGSDYRAGKFTLASPYDINQIEHYLFVPLNQGGTVTFALRSDAAGLPGTELYSTVATLTANTISEGNANKWQGVSGLDWGLDAGVYWVSIEQRAGDTAGLIQRMVGFDSDVPSNPPFPMAAEASRSSASPWLIDGNGANAGWRISATPVPLPAAFWLLLSGLGGVGALARRRR